MEKSIMLLFLFSIILAITSFYLGFIDPSKKLGLTAKSFFILSILILIPLFGAILWFQNGAKERLLNAGVVPYPGLGETVGIAFGLGKKPVWLFRSGMYNSSIGSFYTNENNRPGWKLGDNNGQTVTLLNKGNRMTITIQKSGGESTVMYVIEEAMENR